MSNFEDVVEILQNDIPKFSIKKLFSAADIDDYIGAAYGVYYGVKNIRRALRQLEDKGLIVLDHKEGSTNLFKRATNPDSVDPLHEIDEQPVPIETAEDGTMTTIIKWCDLDTPIEKDFSVENPGLHTLYVGWAMQTLEVLNETIAAFESHSRHPSSELQNDLYMRRRQYILTDTAFRDAAALLAAGFTAYEYIQHHENSVDEFDADE